MIWSSQGYKRQNDYCLFQVGCLDHILVGDKKGGFHTKSVCVDGFVFDESSVLPLQGGAYKIKVSNPEIGMSNKVKSLFPNDWSANDILEAVKKVDKTDLRVGNVKQGWYDDVFIQINYDRNTGQIISVYPVDSIQGKREIL